MELEVTSNQQNQQWSGNRRKVKRTKETRQKLRMLRILNFLLKAAVKPGRELTLLHYCGSIKQSLHISYIYNAHCTLYIVHVSICVLRVYVYAFAFTLEAKHVYCIAKFPRTVSSLNINAPI